MLNGNAHLASSLKRFRLQRTYDREYKPKLDLEVSRTNQQSTISNQQSTTSNQQSTIYNLKFKILFQARLLRRTFRRAQQTVRYGSLKKSPIFFANSFPKSGTHLLTQVLKGFTRLGPAVDSGLPAITTFDGYTGRQRSEEEILSDLERLLPGDVAYGHVHAFPAAITFLCNQSKAAYFILRDPRDVVISHIHYVANMVPKHIHHRYYQKTLTSFEERVNASITGISAEELSDAMGCPIPEPLPSIRARFEPYLGWLERPEILTLHYEEFITNCEETLGQILDHALKHGFTPYCSREKSLHILEESIDPQRSPTFRKGKIGSWQDEFSQDQKRLFKQISGDLLLELGYERSNDW